MVWGVGALTVETSAVPGAAAEVSMLRPCPSCAAKNRVATGHLADVGRCGRCKAALPAHDRPIDIEDAATLDDILKEAKVPVLIDFWAGWCAPCRQAAPHVAATATAMQGKALVVKVDTQKNPTLASRFGIRGIPHFMVMRGGTPVFEHSGVVDAREMQRWLA